MNPVAAGGIRTPDQRLRVFVSSTLKELALERRAARAAIERLALAPVMFELGARPHPPRSLYRAYLEQSDIFVGIYWEQYGWIAPGEEVSGLEDEWNLAPDIPKLIYIKESDQRQERLHGLIARIRDGDTASYVSFSGPAELAKLLTDDLATLLAERFDAGRRDGGPLFEPPPEAGSTEFVRLPSPLTRLLGRDAEVDTVVRMLGVDGVRLVTVTGPGGIGKTRLAIAAARAVEASFPDGIAFVDLAPVQDADLVIPVIAHALGIRDTGARPVSEMVERALAGRRVLLVLDNVEQVVEAAPRISTLLGESSASVLATSRVLLRVGGEQSIDLGPLPDDAATALFFERARAVKPRLEVTPESTSAITAIAGALDGSPLALELAAARVRVFTPSEILARLDHALPLLVDGPRDLPDRQRAMRATIEWSAHLLRGDQRELLLRLGVFRGGFGLDAVEWMAEDIDGADAIEMLGALVDGSLVRERDRGNRAWFSMLSTVGEYARDELGARGTIRACEERHARFYLRLAAEAAWPLTHSGQGEWMSRLVDERDELRAAVTRFIDTRQWDEVVGLVWPLQPFWWVGGHLHEVAGWANRLLEPDVELTGHSRTVAMFMGHASALQRRPDPKLIPVFVDCVERFHAEGDASGEGQALAAIAGARLLQPQPDIESVQATIRRSLELLEQADNAFMSAIVRLFLGQTELMQGRIPAAIEVFESSLASARRVGDRVNESGALNYLGWTRLLTGDLPAARAIFVETLLVTLSTESEWGIAYALEGMSAVAVGSGDPTFAGRLLGAAETIWERKGMFAMSTQSFTQPILARVLAGPDAGPFEQARQSGRDAELTDIVELALA